MKLSKKSQKVLLTKLESDLQEVKEKREKLLDKKSDVIGSWTWERTIYTGQIIYIEDLIREVKDLPF